MGRDDLVHERRGVGLDGEEVPRTRPWTPTVSDLVVPIDTPPRIQYVVPRRGGPSSSQN